MRKKKDIKIENFNIKSSYIEQVKQYKYLGFIINGINSIEKEVKERIALGIKAYYASLKFFKSRLVTKSSKLKLYRTVIYDFCCFCGVYFIINDLVYFIDWNIITLNGRSVVITFLFD